MLELVSNPRPQHSKWRRQSMHFNRTAIVIGLSWVLMKKITRRLMSEDYNFEFPRSLTNSPKEIDIISFEFELLPV
jgi:hypothetical protein